jgi:iron(III) transport system substrate-binding protein
MLSKFTLWKLSCLSLVFPSVTLSAPLPKSTEDILRKLKLDPAILANVESELQVPKEWIDRARKEGKVRIFATLEPTQLNTLLAPFKERYPFIAVETAEASREDRAVRTLVAYKSGRIFTDVLEAVGGTFYMFKEENALEDLRSIPTAKNLPDGAKDPEGFWVGTYKLYWCMAYSTRSVRKEDLPKKWEDLLTNPRWRGGNIGLVNRPNLWLLQLWKTKGEKWARDFIARLFSDVKPQLRKEGGSSLLELLAAGEFHAVIPANPARTYQKVSAGAPLGYHCPEPAPASVNEAVILKGATNQYAARLYLNWLLSKEGQIALYAAQRATPVHRDLARKEFIPFADSILGREESFRDPGLETKVLPRLLEVWSDWWSRGGLA